MARIVNVGFYFSMGSLLIAAVERSERVRAAQPVVSANDKKRAEPDWPSLAPPPSNSAYLGHLTCVRRELDRFKDDAHWRDSLTQTLGTEYSFVGRHKKALACFDELRGMPHTSGPSTMLADYEASDAVDTLVALAGRYQVIMVNEAHHVPLHRAFTIQLLEGLYRKGFRYFAAEALTAKDDALQRRGYPTLKTGYYLHEPLCADLVRIALQLGYQVVPYEFEPDPPQADHDATAHDDFIQRLNIREEGQAKNLKERILGKDPRAKILVHAGYGHISKKPVTWEWNGKEGEVRLMAFAFQKLTGIEPLSIDQTRRIECSDPHEDDGDCRFVLHTGLLMDKPVVLRHKTTKAFFRADEQNDLAVLHPRTRYENGRPTWLALGGRRKPHTLKTDVHPPQDASYLAQAFDAREQGPEAVPVDQMEYGGEEPVPTLWLPSGKFRIRIVDESGNTLHEYSTTLVPE